MPPRMRMTSTPTGSIETGNKLGARPVIRQSQIYRETMSGNAVKDLLGHSDILWDTERQEGVFRGMAVHSLDSGLPGTYQAARGVSGESSSIGERIFQKHVPHTHQSPASVGAEDTYPEPGSRCMCNGCGVVTNVFMHCSVCLEPDLFDLCLRCFAGLYQHRGAPLDLAKLRHVPRCHPKHDIASHSMVRVQPL